VLARCDVRPGLNGMETARRRSITISPRGGALVVLTEAERAKSEGAAAPAASAGAV
jgi:hypothetical protein